MFVNQRYLASKRTQEIAVVREKEKNTVRPSLVWGGYGDCAYQLGVHGCMSEGGRKGRGVASKAYIKRCYNRNKES